MKIDLDQAEGVSLFRTDVCIAGAGIAGLTLAQALIDSGLTVAVLEGGGFAPEQQSQELYDDVEMAGRRHEGATKGRFRIFGGSSTHWGGQLLPYHDDVFSSQRETATDTWPVPHAEIERFYPDVLRMMGVPQEPYREYSLRNPYTESPASDADVRVRFSRWASFGQRNLGGTVGRRCLESNNVTVYVHANITGLELGGPAGDTVSAVHVGSFSGKSFVFTARQVIVCMGVIETCRLLLVSSIGERNDQVGRYFHDHIGVRAATLRERTRQTAISRFAPRLHGSILYTPKLEATRKWRTENNTQAVMAHFPIVEPEDSPVATVKMLMQAFQRGKLPPRFISQMAKLPFGSIELLRMAAVTKLRNQRAISKRAEFRLNIDVEQHPLAESRVSLSSAKDRFGVPRARLDWKVSEREERTVRLFARKIEAELQAVGIGPIEMNAPLRDDNGDWLSIASDTYHMMGGTRMGNSPVNSVVDSNLRVHGLQNLYVASCSIFPTGGSSNPTFTMMALTLRLAEALLADAKRPVARQAEAAS